MVEFYTCISVTPFIYSEYYFPNIIKSSKIERVDIVVIIKILFYIPPNLNIIIVRSEMNIFQIENK